LDFFPPPVYIIPKTIFGVVPPISFANSVLPYSSLFPLVVPKPSFRRLGHQHLVPKSSRFLWLITLLYRPSIPFFFSSTPFVKPSSLGQDLVGFVTMRFLFRPLSYGRTEPLVIFLKSAVLLAPSLSPNDLFFSHSRSVDDSFSVPTVFFLVVFSTSPHFAFLFGRVVRP